MSLDNRQKAFVGYLLRLAEEGKEDRGALADLRSGLGKSPGEMARVHKHVVPHLPEKSYNDQWYYTLAALFGAFPKHRQGHSLGKAFQPLRSKSESMNARFVALLNAHPDDLADHLRHTVSLLKSADPPQPLDWFKLLQDLLQWDHPKRHVQLRWARDFYASAKSTESTENSSETSNEEKNNE